MTNNSNHGKIKVPSKSGTQIKEMAYMNTIGGQIQSQNLLKIKKIVDNDNNGDKFVIVRTKKNIEFMRDYNLNNEDIKDIIRGLSVDDCFAGPEQDRDPQYNGWIFKFDPLFEDTKLYIKIRIESIEKSVCLSVHEFGKYDEVS